MDEPKSYTPGQVFIAADHAGFAAKRAIVNALEGEFTIQDLGAPALEPEDDFTPYAEAVADKIVANPGSLGILICGSGEGMAMAANKIAGIRAAVVWDEAVAIETRTDNDANIAALPARFDSVAELIAISRAFILTPFSGADRYQRRIQEITDLESKER